MVISHLQVLGSHPPSSSSLALYSEGILDELGSLARSLPKRQLQGGPLLVRNGVTCGPDKWPKING